MERKPVTSSMIKSIGFENGQLEVEFRDGKTQRYPATEQEYREMMQSSSIGKHFHSRIKGRTL